MINKALNEEGNNAVCLRCIVQDCNVGKMPYSAFALLHCCFSQKRRKTTDFAKLKESGLKCWRLTPHIHSRRQQPTAKSAVNQGFSDTDRFFTSGWLISKSHAKSVNEPPIWAENTVFSSVKETKIIDYLKGRYQ